MYGEGSMISITLCTASEQMPWPGCTAFSYQKPLLDLGEILAAASRLQQRCSECSEFLHRAICLSKGKLLTKVARKPTALTWNRRGAVTGVVLPNLSRLETPRSIASCVVSHAHEERRSFNAEPPIVFFSCDCLSCRLTTKETEFRFALSFSPLFRGEMGGYLDKDPQVCSGGEQTDYLIRSNRICVFIKGYVQAFFLVGFIKLMLGGAAERLCGGASRIQVTAYLAVLG